MKNKVIITAAILLSLILSFAFGRCTAQPTTTTERHDHNSTNEKTKWTCSMHPQIQQSNPGKCPICSMDLIPQSLIDSSNTDTTIMSMSKASKALAEIQTSLVERRFPEAEIRLTGTLEYDDTKVKSISARFPGRIDELFVNYNGIPINQGEHLARIYSPELRSAQTELITAHKYNPKSSTTHAAKEKLRLWGLLPDQIESILHSQTTDDYLELKAPIGGIAVNKSVNEGDYVTTGQSLFTIVDMNTLWLRLEAFESDISWIRYGQTVSFSVEAYPSKEFSGKIVFIEPELDRKTRTVSVRVNVPNVEGQLKPGMLARAIVHSRIAQGGNIFAPEFAGKSICPMHPEIVKDEPGTCDICGMDLALTESIGYIQNKSQEAPIIIPASAILRTGKRAIVYVELPNTLKPSFEGREIKIGPRAGDFYIVESGLNEGERVVSHGAFKIDSSLQIHGKPSMMAPENDTAQANYLSHKTSLSASTLKSLLAYYFKLQSALAEDNISLAKKELKELQSKYEFSEDLQKTFQAMIEASSIDEIRRPHFENLSISIIDRLEQEPRLNDDPTYLMYCPMVYPDRGAYWLQNHDQLLNPYFGSSMLHCGEIKTER